MFSIILGARYLETVFIWAKENMVAKKNSKQSLNHNSNIDRCWQLFDYFWWFHSQVEANIRIHTIFFARTSSINIDSRRLLFNINNLIIKSILISTYSCASVQLLVIINSHQFIDMNHGSCMKKRTLTKLKGKILEFQRKKKHGKNSFYSIDRKFQFRFSNLLFNGIYGWCWNMNIIQ